MKINIDDQGLISGFSYHDGVLRSISFDSDSRIILTIKNLDGALYIMDINCIKRLFISDVKEENIIDSFLLMKLSSLATARLTGIANIFDFDNEEIFLSFYRDLYFFEMTSSYGARMSAIVEGEHNLRVEISD